jgi:hypothetical protein
MGFRWRRGDPGASETNPLPGQGGYEGGTGPTNEQGFPGSGPAAPWLHGQTPGDVPHQQETVTANQFQWDNIPAGNWTGQVMRHIGLDPDRRDDTEIRGNITISADVPGGQNCRNTSQFELEAKPDGVNRYVYGGESGGPYVAPGTEGNPTPSGMWNDAQTSEQAGRANAVYPPRVNGGYSTWFFNRRMPYTAWGYGRRGSQNSGFRFYLPPENQFGDGYQMGHYGERVRGSSPRHRPTVFAEPAPWTTTYYDTNPSTGSPLQPGTAGQQAQQVYISPDVPRGGNYRRGG